MPCVRTAEGLWPRFGRVRVVVWGHDGLGCRGAEEPVRWQKPRFGRSLGCERRVELNRRYSPMLLAAPRSAVLLVVCHSQAFEKGELSSERCEVAAETRVAPARALPESRPDISERSRRGKIIDRGPIGPGRGSVGPDRGSRYSKRAYLRAEYMYTNFIRRARSEIRGKRVYHQEWPLYLQY